jgi:hypothetical protein
MIAAVTAREINEEQKDVSTLPERNAAGYAR